MDGLCLLLALSSPPVKPTAVVQTPTPVALLSSAEASRAGPCRAALLGPVAALGHWRAGQVRGISRERRRKEPTAMHSSTREACSRLEIRAPKATETSLFPGLILPAADNDPLILTLHFCEVKQNKRKSLDYSFIF